MMNESAGCFGICAQHPQDIRPCHHSPDHFGSLMETSGHTWRGEEDILSSADGETNVTLRFGEHPGISLPLSHLVPSSVSVSDIFILAGCAFKNNFPMF
jgi:hypothetical protein